MTNFLIIIFTFFLVACNSDLSVMPSGGKSNRVYLEKLDRLSALAGDQVAVSGGNLSAELSVLINGKSAPFTLLDSSNGTFIVPSDVDLGLLEIVFFAANKKVGTFPLMNAESVEGLPILPVDAQSVCDHFIFKNASSVLVRGLASCDKESSLLCSRDGEIDCESSFDFPVALKSGLAGKLAPGKSVAGVHSTEICGTDATLPLKAVLAGGPIGTTESTTLQVAVGGDEVVQYKYKVREEDDPPCSDPSGYSKAFTADTPIASNVADKANGLLQLCVIGMDADGNWQSPPSTSHWTKNSPSPTASFEGEPEGAIKDGVLDVSVAGTGASSYKYKIRTETDPPCSDSSGYSAEKPLNESISEDLSSYPEGTLELCVIARNAGGQWQSTQLATTASWTIDRTAPVGVFANLPQLESRAAALDVKVGGSAVTDYKYKIRDASDPACSDISGYSASIPATQSITDSLTSFADGSLELCVLTRDSAENWQSEAAATAFSWTKDTSAPVSSLSGAPVGTNSNALLNVSVSGIGVSHYKYKLRGAISSACSDASGYSAEGSISQAISDSIATRPDGLLELCVIGRDAAGNWQAESAATTASWTKDTLPPLAIFSGAPSGSSALQVLNTTVGGIDVVEYRYKIREAVDTNCSDITGYSGALPIATPISNNTSALSDGALEICVIGKDSAGNWQLEGTASIAAWTKDTQAPTAELTNEPSGSSSIAALNVTVSGAEVTFYKFKIRAAADPSCANSSGYSGETPISTGLSSSVAAFADGALELCVIGRDAAGNWQTEGAATTTNWIKDTLAPTASIAGAPVGTNSTTTLNVSIAGAGVTHYKFKIRDVGATACSNATGYSALTPVGTLISSNISALADGAIELCVIGRDSAGNFQSMAAATSIGWTKDALPPVASLSGVPSGSSQTTALDITVAGADVVQYKYKIRTSSDPVCSNSSGYSAAAAVATHITDSISALADGALEICVVGQDATGNWQLEGTATVSSWTKDTTAPVALINDAPSGSNNAAVLNVTVSGTDVSHYKYKLREAADTACSNSAGYSAEQAVSVLVTDSLASLGEGSLELCVIARDIAGNWQLEAVASSRSWVKDTAAPTATLSGAPTGTNGDTVLNITVAGTSVTHYKFKLREVGDSACSNSSGYSTEAAVSTAIGTDFSALADGVLQVCVIGRDSAGNWQAEAAATSASWTKDALPSTATLTGAPSGASKTTSLDIAVGGVDVVQYRYKLRENSDPACSNSAGYSGDLSVATHITNDISGLADGVLEICVISKDSSGNWQLLSAATSAPWTKDTQAPTASLSNEPTGTNNVVTLNVSVGGTGISHYKYKLRETGDTACSNSGGYSGQVAVATPISNSIAALGDGALELCVIGRDAAGNWQTEASATAVGWTKDTAAPTASISNAPTATNSVTTLNVTIAGAAVSHYKYKIRESLGSACSNSSDYSSEIPVATHISDDISSKADGTIELCVIGRDSSGNWQAEASAATASWTKDALPPAASLSGVPAGNSLVTGLDITVAGADVVQYKYKLRESGDSGCSNSTGYGAATAIATHITPNIAGLADGVLEICVIGVDGSGNWQLEGTATAASWTKDTVAPTATIANEPTGTNNTTSLNITIAGTDVSHYKFKIREPADTACSDNTGYSAQIAVANAITSSISALDDGSIELCVIGRDAAGNWQTEGSATAVGWTKDTAAPTASIGGAPTGTNAATALNVTISGAEVSHYKFKLRGPSDLACSNAAGYSSEAAVATLITADFSSLSDGTIQLCVIGRDASGNWKAEGSATTVSWIKDALPPTATLSGAPSGSSLATSLNITVAGADVVQYRYKLREAGGTLCSNTADYGAATAVSTPITNDISALLDGVLEVCVIGQDASGNWQTFALATIGSWSKDTAAPTATIGNAPTGTNNITTLNVTIAGSDVSHYKYKIRDAGDTACSNSADYSAQIAVATHITSDISALIDGTIELCVVGRDSAGNWQTEALATAVSWTKDASAPTAIITNAPSATNNATVLNVTVSGAGISHYKFKLRAAADSACSSSADYSAEVAVGTPISTNFSAQADGVFELCVLGRDAINNWQAEASATTVSWTKDTSPPAAVLSGALSGSSLTTSLDITVGGVGVTQYKYKIRESADTVCSDSADYSAAIPIATHITTDISLLSDGAFEACVIARDAAGNWQLEAAATSASWTKDTSAPTAIIDNEPTGSSNGANLNVTISGTGVSHYKYKIRESGDTACANSAGYSAQFAIATPITASLTGLSDGTIELCAIGRDSAGNWQTEASATAVSWTRDTAAPTASIGGAPSSSNNTTTLNVTISGADVSHYKFKIREAGDTACSNAAGYSTEAAVGTPISSSLSALADGVIELCVIGRDTAGNWQALGSAATASWTKDTNPPAATLLGAPSASSLTTNLDITVAGTGVTQYKYKIREAADTACSNSADYSIAIAVGTHIADDISALTDGVIEVCVVGQDASGNWQLEGTATIASWTKDTGAPSASITNPPTGTNNTTTLNVTIAGTGVSHYKYKIRSGADTACSDSTGYSGQVIVATPISNSISALSDGTIELCVIGRDAAGNWQTEISAASASWTKDATAPAATIISNAPGSPSNATALNITISGADVSHYRYKIRVPADTACSNATGYSSEAAVATPITDSILALADETIQICAIGRDSLGNWQAYSSAGTASWTKDTAAPSIDGGTDKLVKALASLNATASDGGSGIASYAWTKISGPGGINFSAASSEDSNASATLDGDYVLRLTVTDQAGNSAFDEVNFVWDTTAPTDPASVGFGSSYSASTSLSLSWLNSSDAHFSTHNVKICTANNCSTGCISPSTDPSSPGTASGVNGASYYACVQGEDSVANKSNWVASLVTIAVDTTAPTANSLSINAAAAYTNAVGSTLTLSATGADEMYITNTSGCGADGNWESYATSKAWNLGQSNNIATVYVKFRDFAGNQSGCINDTIIHDGQVPTSPSISIDAGAASTSTTSVTLTLAATDPNPREMYVTNSSGCAAGGSWETFNTSKSWTLGQTGGTATVYVAFRDVAGNVTSCINDTITHISGPPTSPTIAIEAGAATVSDTTATLTLSASGATEMYVTNDSSCTAGGAWSAYATSKSWVLSANQSRSATVYVKYRNATMLESSCVNDSITVQSPNLLTNADFETGDATGWTISHAGKWVVDNTNVNMGTYSAHTNATAASTSTCIYQVVDLTAALEDQVVDFNWAYGTQTNGDYADFIIDATTKISLSGPTAGWTSHSYLVTKGAARTLKWCYRKNGFTVANGDYVRLDEIRLGSPVLMPPVSVSSVGTNATVALTITAPAAPPSGYLILRGTSAVNFTPVNGTVYPTGALGSYQVIQRGSSLTPNDTGLANGTTYHYGVYSYDASDNYSLATVGTGLPWGSYTPSGMTATKGNAQVALSWTTPSGGSQIGYIVFQKAGSDVTDTPVNGTGHVVGTTVGSSTVIYRNASLSYTKTGLTNNTQYYYKVWSYDSAYRYSVASAGANATPDNCVGQVYSNKCWYVGNNGQSCNQTCSANSRTYNASSTAGTSCSNVSTALGINSTSNENQYQGDYLCAANGSQAYKSQGSGNTGDRFQASYRPICVCQ